ncbi:PREDICTED: putative gustatory receptor 23a [Trachymyrmex septentrionalis]|uniref:putative gustatory receptor 23a n=1 Tax=Trachymyrmex septentrionalis TaxID=34720 RepID=UPI00084F105D|nr:PREDICTED: putative gustatory receptor 23a [Trachymyrmex septentrionalis]
MRVLHAMLEISSYLPPELYQKLYLFQENQQQSDTYAKDYDKRYKDMCSQFNLPHAKESVSVNRTQAPEKAAFNSQQYRNEFLKIILIVWTCETNKNRALEISTTVHDVLNRTSDKQIKEELYLFSLQIMHCKNTLSTKGLSINATLLATMTVVILHTTLLAFQIEMLYINCVSVVKACFKEIDDNMENLRELIMNSTPRWIPHKQRYPFLLMKLKDLKKQHLMISNTVQMLNLMFGLQLLASTTQCFKQIVFYLYFNVVHWQNGISLNRDKIYSVNFISFLAHYIIRLMLIAWACETSKNQAIKISTTVHDVLNSINNVQIKHELNLFSLQILHCDNTFSMKGLTLDATLLTMIVSKVFTYLLILIQFLIMTHSCDSKTGVIKDT